MRLPDVGGDFLALHHRLPAGGELVLLAGPDGELDELVIRMAGEIGLRFGGGDAPALGVERPLGRAHRAIGVLRRSGLGLKAAIGVDERAMGRRIGQGPLVMLAMDLDQRGGEPAQSLDAHALVVDIGARASVGELDPSQNELVADLDVLPFEQRMGGVSRRQLECRGHLALGLAMANEAAVAAPAQRQRQRVEQDRSCRRRSLR